MKTVFVAIWITLLVIACSWALFVPGLFFIHDFVHGARIAEMTQALRDGHFPVRWSDDFGYGYGMPLFEFYAPLPFYVGSIFHLLGVSLVGSVKTMFFISNLLTALGAYYLGKSLYGRIGGLLTAAVITLAPYRAVNLFVRGAISETWGLMAAVWVLFFTVQVIKGKRAAWLGLVISLCGVFLSHNLLTLLFVPFAVALAGVLLILKIKKFKPLVSSTSSKVVIGQLLMGYLLAGAVSAFYLVPAFLEKDFTKIQETIIGGYFDYHLHFLYLRQFFTPFWSYGGSEWGPDDKMSFFLGIGQLLTLLLAGAAVVKGIVAFFRKQDTEISPNRVILGSSLFILLAISLVFTTEKTLLIWNTVPLLSFVQFPWRFLSVAVILIGLLAPIALLVRKRFVARWLLGWFLVLLLLPNAYYFRPEKWLDSAESLYYSDRQRIRTDMSGILPDYIPQGLNAELPPALEAYECKEGCSKVETLVDRTHEKLFSVEVDSSARFVTQIASYPGWILELDGQEQTYETNDGRIAVTLPPGTWKVGVRFGSTPTRQTADFISLAGVLTLVGSYLYYFYQDKKYAK